MYIEFRTEFNLLNNAVTNMKYKPTFYIFMLFYFNLNYRIVKSEFINQENNYEENLNTHKPDESHQKISEIDPLDEIITLDSIFSHNMLQFNANTSETRKLKEIQSIKDGDINDIDKNNIEGFNMLLEIKRDIIKQGVFKLNTLAAIIKETMKISSVSEAISNVSKHFTAEIDTYFNVTNKREVKSEIDWEFYFLHIIETCNTIFSNEAQMLYNIIMVPISIDRYIDVNFKVLRDLIENTVIEDKRDNLQYVCENFHICRIFPTYSDNMAKLLKRILWLSDINFGNVIKIFRIVVKKRSTFLESVMDDETKVKITNAFIALKDITEFRDFLLVISNIISQRHLMFASINEKINSRMKAVKILIDIIDKTFERIGHDYNDYSVLKVLKGVTEWDIKKSVEIRKILESYFKEMFNVLNMNLFPETRYEIKVLSAFILTGITKNSTLIELLLDKGSTFIRNDNMFSPMNSLAHALF